MKRFDPNLRLDPVGTLLRAYRRGIFPMADSDDPGGNLRWFRPEVRAILPLSEAEGFHLPRRLGDRWRARPFTLTTDLAFEAVMRGCARPRRDDAGTWIDDRLVRAYTALHEAGHAHSIEAWNEPSPGADGSHELESDGMGDAVRDGDGRVLVGGLYGVQVGAAFMAESKFHRADLGGSDASKICLVALVRHLASRGVALCDVQFWNPHIAQFGVREIPGELYERRLAEAVDLAIPWGPAGPLAV